MRETQRLAELGLLTAKLVHELRQPLFAARALGQLAGAASRPEQVAAHVEAMLTQLDTLERLLSGYADLSRHPDSERGAFDVWRAINGAVAVLEHRAKPAGVAIICEGEGALLVEGPVLAVQQVIVNLGANAIDALHGVHQPMLRIEVFSSPKRIRLSDNGPGLDPRISDRLFEPFRTTKVGGTGLGLLLSRDLARGFGGELTLIEATQGVCWEVSLP